QLVKHDGWDYHLHATPPDAPLADRMAVEAAMAFADVIRTQQLERLRLCAADDCHNVHVDLSKNRSRRVCSTLCANPTHGAAPGPRPAPGPATGPRNPPRPTRPSGRMRSGSASRSMAAFSPPLMVKPNTIRGWPCCSQTAPAAPFTSAGRTARARPEKVPAT